LQQHEEQGEKLIIAGIKDKALALFSNVKYWGGTISDCLHKPKK